MSGYSIVGNYSVFNNYIYEHKPLICSILDGLSSPCRRVFGGRNVSVISQMHGEKATNRVAILFFSILIFPIAVVSIATLLIKLATFPCIWEKRKVTVQSRQTCAIIQQFNDEFRRNKYSDAIKTFLRRPEIRARDHEYNTLFTALNQSINAGGSWEEIQKALSFLKSDAAIALIDHAVKVRLSYEFVNSCHSTSANSIILFIRNSLNAAGSEQIEACCKKLLSSALNIDVQDDLVCKAVKMDIADHLIRAFSQSAQENPLAPLQEFLLRPLLFKEGQNHWHWMAIFNSADDMQQVSRVVQNLRDIDLIGGEFLNKLNTLSKECSTNQEQWKILYSELSQYRNRLIQLALFLDREERLYLESHQKMLACLIDSTESLWKALSVRGIESTTNHARNMLEDHREKCKREMTQVEGSGSGNHLKNLLLTLNLKKRAALIIYSEKINSFLYENMTRTASTILQTKAVSP